MNRKLGCAVVARRCHRGAGARPGARAEGLEPAVDLSGSDRRTRRRTSPTPTVSGAARRRLPHACSRPSPRRARRGYKGHIKHIHRPKPFFFHLRKTSLHEDGRELDPNRPEAIVYWYDPPRPMVHDRLHVPRARGQGAGATRAPCCRGTRTATGGRWSCTRGSPTICAAASRSARRGPSWRPRSSATSAIRPRTSPPDASRPAAGTATARSRLTRALAAFAVAAACLAGDARAHDSLAPPGASHNWLPEEEWVHRHWIPFDERALVRARARSRAARGVPLRRSPHARGARGRARARPGGARRPARRAVAGDRRDRAVLRERTLRILTQGHLAQHMFFHVFHGLELRRALRPCVRHARRGLPGLRRAGLSYTEIAARGEVPIAALRDAGHVDALIANRQDGLARREAGPAQAGRILARTLARLGCWLRRPPPERDPSNPYGKNRFLHGAHVAAWPATAAERRRTSGAWSGSGAGSRATAGGTRVGTFRPDEPRPRCCCSRSWCWSPGRRRAGA